MAVDFNVRESKTPHDIYCDYCGVLIGAVDDGYINHFSFHTKTPKISLRCNLCDKHQRDNNFRRGCIIKGLGRIDPKILDERDIMQQIENEQAKAKAKYDQLDNQINWGEVENTIKSTQITTKSLASKYGASVEMMKSLLLSRYGDTIEFRKGRNGGVKFKGQ